ncbi:MAG: glycoside hydrolase family 127 protein [Acidobacteriota bacterium]|nr:glycoside hydrolase family 127 protein [Acidobacteriota bacterium]
MRTLALFAAALALQAATPNRAPLQPNAFNLLPLGSVEPKGWLLEQLKIQAAGLSGHLDEFWPDLGPDSAWLGGKGEGWERGPYFLDGLVPLAYLTQDPVLIAKVRKWMDWALDHQSPEGWIGPAKNTDWWPNYVMLKALMQYQEASGDARVIPAMRKYFAYQLAHLDQRPLKEWAIFRWHDEVLSVLWLYNRTGDASLLDLARKLHQQGHDWEAQFADFKTTELVPRGKTNLSTHGVNNAMALKAAAVWWLVTGDPADRAAADTMLRALDRYHGQPNGIFSADEHYAGRDPSQGTELCAVVEAMFSLEQDLAILGEPSFGDRLEKIAYNALPATLSPDLWAHQYDQQANQIVCSISNHRWATNGPESNIFGLEPNFGCCTANMHQGWPKLAANLWMATPDEGLAAVVYGPSEVATTVRGGVAVRIEEQTEYPFRESVVFTVRPARAAVFPVALRIPEWAAGATVAVNGAAVAGVQAGGFLRIEREWQAGDRIEARFPMAVRLSHWYNNSIAVERGPLVYSLRVSESWHKIRQTGPAADWEIYPASPWNYGLVADPANFAGAFTVKERPLARQPFTAMDSPVEITAKARRVPQWQLVEDSPAPIPVSPVTSRRPEETVTMVPYGAAKLRITAFPYLIPGKEEPPRK